MKKISIVEDDAGIRDVLQAFFETEDIEVESFNSIFEFMYYGDGSCPDLFLLDIQLPDGSGLDLCRKIKLHERYRNIPVVLMSANATSLSLDTSCNPDLVMCKPFDLNDLIENMKALTVG